MAGRDWLTQTLRDLRKARGLSGMAAAAAAGISQSRISRIESGRFLPTEDEIRSLCRLYRAPAAIRKQLLTTVRDLNTEIAPARVVIQRGAWKLQRRIARIEAASAEICVYQPALVPGLLQTEEYMRAVFADGGDITDEDLEQSVAARAGRAAILGTDRDFTLIMTEGALRWQATSPGVMLRQLDHIAELAQRIRIGVIPWTQPASVFTTHGFSMYDRREVIIGIRTGTSVITDPIDVADYVKLFAALEGMALFGEAAYAVIAAAATDYRTLE